MALAEMGSDPKPLVAPLSYLSKIGSLDGVAVEESDVSFHLGWKI